VKFSSFGIILAYWPEGQAIYPSPTRGNGMALAPNFTGVGPDLCIVLILNA